MKRGTLEFDGIWKAFHGATVLREVSFPVRGGAVLGLVGENGAGKSTLMNIMGGNLFPDRGRMWIGGTPFAPRSPLESARAGIALVHQEPNLFPNLSVAENLFLSDLPRLGPEWLRWIDRESLKTRAQQVLERVRLGVEPSTLVEELSPGERQLLEIAGALKGRPRIVAFDEPTTSLTRPECERLYEIIRGLRTEEVAVIYISHNLGEVTRLCDEIVVLRDGAVEGRGERSRFTIPKMIQLMVGRELATLFPERRGGPGDGIALEVSRLSQPGVVEDASLVLRRGEILGIAGLMGSGRTELARMIFGLDPSVGGRVSVRGRPIASPSPAKSVGSGMAFLTEDRKKEGLLPLAGVKDNMALVALGRFSSRLGVVKRVPLSRSVEAMAEKLDIRFRELDRQAVGTLSGGNQQKVVLGRWLLGGAEILILDEPTRGVDVGARFQIYERIVELADGGASILLISSDLEELVGLSDRILILSRGKVQTTVDRRDFNRHELLRSALGEERLT